MSAARSRCRLCGLARRTEGRATPLKTNRLPSLSLFALLFGASIGCTDAGVYTLQGGGVPGPDRTAFEGTVCVPEAVGSAFPVKVVFAMEGGATTVTNAISSSTLTAIATVVGLQPTSTSFAFIVYHVTAQGFTGFTDATTLQGALSQYGTFQESGPVSIASALELADSLISGDMQTSCRGTVNRTRYVVILLEASVDTACLYPSIYAGINSDCLALPNPSQCAACYLQYETGQITALQQQYSAGGVTVQPIYITDIPSTQLDPNIDLVNIINPAIAAIGGSQPEVATSATINTVLSQVNLSSLQSQLALKRFFAFNRNAMAREGQELIDSDGDGLSDDYERTIGTDPTLYDTDGDGIGDGVEVKMGLDPLTPNIVLGCNASLDTDQDKLNDCEERVLGTDACVADSDGDGLSDFIEFMSQTNPLVPEALQDDDRDGTTNADEVTKHSDPESADQAYQADRGYQYTITAAAPTPDGRACYTVRVDNVSLVRTLELPNKPLTPIPAGNNEIYLYMQSGRPNDPNDVGIASIFTQEVNFNPPGTKTPSGVISFGPTDYVVGQ